jgi:hypothetical protein
MILHDKFKHFTASFTLAFFFYILFGDLQLTFICAAAVGFLWELTQHILKIGTCSCRDVMADVFGVSLATLVLKLMA